MNKPSAGFAPQSAGSRDYERLTDAGQSDGASQARMQGRTGTRTAPSANAVAGSGSQRKAHRVNIKISGPAIGTAPHYLRYSVDLPRDKLAGADYLWMDNGVWIGDEAAGVKILESPGLHFITVLVVTKDDGEYRGQAKVQVLERGPTAANIGTHTPPGDG